MEFDRETPLAQKQYCCIENNNRLWLSHIIKLLTLALIKCTLYV